MCIVIKKLSPHLLTRLLARIQIIIITTSMPKGVVKEILPESLL